MHRYLLAVKKPLANRMRERLHCQICEANFNLDEVIYRTPIRNGNRSKYFCVNCALNTGRIDMDDLHHYITAEARN